MKTYFYLSILLVLSTLSQSQTYNHYFGNIHSHSGYSDGNKDFNTTNKQTPADDYTFAKLSQNFHFLGISDHNHSNAGMQKANYALGIQQAAAANTDGSFVCLYGNEYGVISNGGHVLLYGFNQLIGWENNNYDIYNAIYDYAGLFSKVNQNPNSFISLAHPEDSDYGNLANMPYNASADSAISGLPLRSGPAFSTSQNYDDFSFGDYIDYYQKMLAKDYKLGMGYDHDNHYLTFGRNNAGRLVVVAPSLTQTNIVQGIKKMNMYGSDDWNAKVNFTINSQIVGSVFSGTTTPQISVTHNDLDGETVNYIRVYSGVVGSGLLPAIVSSGTSNTLLYTDNTLPLYTTRYYYLHIKQSDGDEIVTSPIWYTYTNITGVEETKKEDHLLFFPNPTCNQLHVSTDVVGTHTLTITDIAGRVVFEKQTNNNQEILDVSSLPKGYYTLTLLNKTTSTSKKLIVE